MEEKIKEKTQEAKETIKENRPMKTVEDSRTKQVHLIMHQHLNAGGRLFGGMLMQWWMRCLAWLLCVIAGLTVLQLQL